MEQAIILQNKHWKGDKYSQIFDRPILQNLIDKLVMKEIQVLLGIRRSGKSTIFRLLINHLMLSEKPKSILFINCEDPFFAEIWNDASKIYNIVELAEKITGSEINYLFLDEIQVIKNWEKYIKSVYEAQRFKKIFVTGSNSNLLEGDYINMLSGRYLSDIVYPLSFPELLAQNELFDKLDLLSENPSVLRILDNVLANGSFPEVIKIKNDELKRQLLLNYYETIVLKDCLLNNKVRDNQLFRILAHYILSNIASVFSYNSLAKALNSNENTMKQYVQILENSYIIKEIQHFSFSLKANLKIKKKIYCIDNGLINAISLSFSSNFGKLLENLVYAELLKTKKFEIFFYNETEECDFIIKYQKQLIAIQVVYELNTQNETRELAGLKSAMKKFKITNSFIVTYNRNEKINDISIISFSQMLLHLESILV
jgi:uncharacterized protein